MSEGEAQPQPPVEEPFDLELASVRYLDGVISQQAIAQLNALLAEDVAARKRFVDICVQARELREVLAPRSALAPILPGDPDFEPRRFESILVELARQGYLKVASTSHTAETTDPGDVSSAMTQVLPRRIAGTPTEQTHALSIHVSRRFLAIAATVFLAASIALVLSLRARSAATLTGIAGAKWASADVIKLGNTLRIGKLIHLESGAVEISFASSASVVVQGPAAFRVTGRNEALLEYGKIVAHVPPPAHGFAVRTASMNVTDLGTEFGLNVTRAGEANVEVFAGTIEVASPEEGSAQPSRLTEGQAAICEVESTEIRPATRGTIAFARDLSQVRVPLMLHGTGVAAQEGGPDPYWRIVSETANPAFVPQPAVSILSADLDGLGPNDPPHSKWISTDAIAPTVPAGKYVFKTSIDLTGLDPKTADIRLQFWVDDELREIRINGRSNKIPIDRLRGSAKHAAPWSMSLTDQSGLRAGVNDVEFVVYNALGRTALRVAWEGTAVPRPEK